MLSDISQTQKSIARFHLYVEFKIGKHTDTENGMVVTGERCGSGGGGLGRCWSQGHLCGVNEFWRASAQHEGLQLIALYFVLGVCQESGSVVFPPHTCRRNYVRRRRC